jgi:hypothetical protein
MRLSLRTVAAAGCRQAAHDDAVRARRWFGRIGRRGVTTAAVWAVATGATAAVVGRYGELSRPALAAVLAAGCGVGAIGLVRRAGSAAPAVGRAGAAPWLTWVAVVAAWESYSRFLDRDVPTLSDLLDPVLAHRALRAAATVAWFAAGAWLASRPSRHRRPR